MTGRVQTMSIAEHLRSKWKAVLVASAWVAFVAGTCISLVYESPPTIDMKLIRSLEGSHDYQEASDATWESLGWSPPSSPEDEFRIVELDVGCLELTNQQWKQIAKLPYLTVIRCCDSNIPDEILLSICRRETLHELWVGNTIDGQTLLHCVENENIHVLVVGRRFAKGSFLREVLCHRHIGAVFVIDEEGLHQVAGVKIGFAGAHFNADFGSRVVDWNQ